MEEGPASSYAQFACYSCKKLLEPLRERYNYMTQELNKSIKDALDELGIRCLSCRMALFNPVVTPEAVNVQSKVTEYQKELYGDPLKGKFPMGQEPVRRISTMGGSKFYYQAHTTGKTPETKKKILAGNAVKVAERKIVILMGLGDLTAKEAYEQRMGKTCVIDTIEEKPIEDDCKVVVYSESSYLRKYHGVPPPLKFEDLKEHKNSGYILVVEAMRLYKAKSADESIAFITLPDFLKPAGSPDYYI